MPDSPTSEPEVGFVCDCDQWMRSACEGEPFYREHQGKRYCVLHFPGKEKSADFKKVVQRKLDNEDLDFCGAYFPEKVSFNSLVAAKADFRYAAFSAEVNFVGATFKADAKFSGASFDAQADFVRATFDGMVDFNGARFSGVAHFMAATFRKDARFPFATFSTEANFLEATFKARTVFVGATFNARASFSRVAFRESADFAGATFRADTDFENATFSGETRFRDATIEDRVRFAGEEKSVVFSRPSSLDLQFARIEKPDQVSFHSLTLLPHWFVNVDARRFDFINVDWGGRPLSLTIREELDSLKDKHVLSPNRMLAIACRQLAVNAEENHRYEEASRFRYMAMDARRRERWRGFAVWRMSWWYWLASGYGERILQAFLVLLGIWFVAALLYAQVGFVRWEPRLASQSDADSTKRDEFVAPLKFSRALTYSAGVMTLQKPEPRPATIVAQTIVLLETVLGPVQAALLALAIRRKFMR